MATIFASEAMGRSAYGTTIVTEINQDKYAKIHENQMMGTEDMFSIRTLNTAKTIWEPKSF